ncbi:Sua5/YciO/YrdC/YwlC family protein [Colwellia polaris]|jgi:L-threonylcarbamoyladenylate synthase|uniref:Sua5/YciO/YrdC/YwlC family protein n=1 Tax=Colwellia polaris TaxID=326537 RepID=UPI000A171280|nr:Sua5/YciO/YrdC/YwlC family protein [Colwellia polaris]|tara:strand:- start:52 stop:597 length:546 start_codon:yes stop_codon:yes gene_type:complete
MATALETFQQGGVLAYPTESVFGLGCDPDNSEAIDKLLSLKSRSADKGLILLAGNYSQLLPYIDDDQIPQDKRFAVLSRWPDGITQLVAKNINTSALLTGGFDKIAVRVTSQPDVVALCLATNKPIVSTSANLSGQSPAKTWQEIPHDLAVKIDFIIKGKTLGYEKPSTIIDALSGEVIRS